jgi:hypothetical protein
MIDLRFRPLEKKEWPGELAGERSQFKMKFGATLDLLECELRKLQASNVIVEAGFTLQQLRNDGWPHAGAHPTHAGVTLYFDSPEGPLRFPCGTYKSWQANLHAIALTLEKLRAIDRYGVTLTHQQYAGFKMLAAPDGRSLARHAATIIASLAVRPVDYIMEDAESFRLAYRAAAVKCHPDTTSGREQEWTQLQEAKRVMEAYYSAPAAG